jgi:hypothetical protein
VRRLPVQDAAREIGTQNFSISTCPPLQPSSSFSGCSTCYIRLDQWQKILKSEGTTQKRAWRCVNHWSQVS